MFGDGKFWMIFWSIVFAVMLLWGFATFAWWMDSVRNLNALSIVAVWLASAAGFQSTLAMRKSDPQDPL
jgi:hypothetical protein